MAVGPQGASTKAMLSRPRLAVAPGRQPRPGRIAGPGEPLGLEVGEVGEAVDATKLGLDAVALRALQEVDELTSILVTDRAIARLP